MHSTNYASISVPKLFFTDNHQTLRLSHRQKQTSRLKKNRTYSERVSHLARQTSTAACHHVDDVEMPELFFHAAMLPSVALFPRRSRFYVHFLIFLDLVSRIPRVDAAPCYTPGGLLAAEDCYQLPKGSCLVLGSLVFPEDKRLNFPGFNVALGHSDLDSSQYLTPHWLRTDCFFYRKASTDYWRNNPVSEVALEANSVAIYGNVQLKDWVIKTTCDRSINEECFAGELGGGESHCGFIKTAYYRGVLLYKPISASPFSTKVSDVCGSVLIAPVAHLIGERTYLEVGSNLYNMGMITLEDTYRLLVKGHLMQLYSSNTIFFKYPVNSQTDIDFQVNGDVKGGGNIIAEGKPQSP